GRRIDTALALPVLDDQNVPISTAYNAQRDVAIAAMDTGFLAAWSDARNALVSDVDTDVYAARVAGNGAVVDPAGILVARATNDERQASVASDGSSYLVTWSDNRGEAGDVYGARFDMAGTPLGAPFAISAGPRGQTNPSVAFSAAGGGTYVAAWVDRRKG